MTHTTGREPALSGDGEITGREPRLGGTRRLFTFGEYLKTFAPREYERRAALKLRKHWEKWDQWLEDGDD